MRKLALLLLSAVVVGGTGVLPAQASTTTVAFSADLSGLHTIADCDVTVPEHSNGIAVLDEAVDIGCIDSYDTDTFPGFGEYVTCINGICGAVATYWALYVDDVYSEVGVSNLSFPSDGSSMHFSYEQWVVPTP